MPVCAVVKRGSAHNLFGITYLKVSPMVAARRNLIQNQIVMDVDMKGLRVDKQL